MPAAPGAAHRWRLNTIGLEPSGIYSSLNVGISIAREPFGLQMAAPMLRLSPVTSTVQARMLHIGSAFLFGTVGRIGRRHKEKKSYGKKDQNHGHAGPCATGPAGDDSHAQGRQEACSPASQSVHTEVAP